MIVNDLNSVLLEGTVVATEAKAQGEGISALKLRSARKAENGGKKPTLTVCRVDLCRCQSGGLSELTEGRMVRIVGRLSQIGRASLCIIADHVEIKPLARPVIQGAT